MQLQQENFWNPKDWFDGWSGGFAGTMKGPLNPLSLAQAFDTSSLMEGLQLRPLNPKP